MVSLRQKFPRASLSVACAATLAVLLAAAPAGALTISGRAYAVYINIPSIGIIDQTFIDTGYLPPTGGSDAETAPSVSVADLVQTGLTNTESHGDDCEGHSSYQIDSAVLLPGEAGEISFSHAHGDDDDQCCDSPHHPHSAYIEDLVFGGVPINVTGEFDQTVTIPGVGTLTINHRHGGGFGSDSSDHGHHHGDHGDEGDCGDDQHVSVYALYLSLENGGEVTVGSAFFRSHDHCCAVPTRASTWGSIKALYDGK